MKQIYEIINECKQAKDINEVLSILNSNSSKVLHDVLYYTYHPDAKWYINEFPKNYKKPDTLPGVAISNLYTELRMLYLFQVGHQTADGLDETRRNELLLQVIEGMEPGEAEVFINIMKGDLGIPGLTFDVLFPKT
jgi:hypothetical protein